MQAKGFSAPASGQQGEGTGKRDVPFTPPPAPCAFSGLSLNNPFNLRACFPSGSLGSQIGLSRWGFSTLVARLLPHGPQALSGSEMHVCSGEMHHPGPDSWGAAIWPKGPRRLLYPSPTPRVLRQEQKPSKVSLSVRLFIPTWPRGPKGVPATGSDSYPAQVRTRSPSLPQRHTRELGAGHRRKY